MENENEENKITSSIVKMLDDYAAGHSLIDISYDQCTKSKNDVSEVSNSIKHRRTIDDSLNSTNEESPFKRHKLSDDSSLFLLASPSSELKLKGELLEAKAQITSLEERLNKMHSLNKEILLVYESEKNCLKTKIEKEAKVRRELSMKLKNSKLRERELHHDHNLSVASFHGQKDGLIKQMVSLHNKNSGLKDQLNAVVKNKEDANREMQLEDVLHHMGVLKRNLQLSERVVQELKEELQKARKELTEREKERIAYIDATQKIKELLSEKESYMESKTYVESQHQKLQRYSQLEKDLHELREENSRLKSSMSNTLYLETVVEDLKRRQTTLDSFQDELVKLKSENLLHLSTIKEWNELVKQYCGCSGTKQPIMMMQETMEELLKKEQLYMSTQSEMKLRVNGLQEKYAKKEEEILELKKQMDSLKTTSETYANTIRRLKKQLQIVTWERNDLRNLLDSCHKELTIVSHDSSDVDALHKAIEGYKERTIRIENDPSLIVDAEITTKPSSLIAERNILLKKEKELNKQVEELTNEVQYLKDLLEYKSWKSDYDSKDTKVIHYRYNPASEAAKKHNEEVAEMVLTLARLKERINVLEEGNNGQDITNIVESRVTATSEVEELREKLKSQETKYSRLCKIFKKKSHEFREAVYVLFGFKVDAGNKNLYKLTSMYAEDPDDVLLFQIPETSEGNTQLIENTYSKSLTHLIHLYLNQHNSIPAFLSSLTMELVVRRTVSMTASSMTMTMMDTTPARISIVDVE